MDHTKKIPNQIAFYFQQYNEYHGYITKKNEVQDFRTKDNWAITAYRNHRPKDGDGHTMEEHNFGDLIMSDFVEMEYLLIENKTLIITKSGCKENAFYFAKLSGLIINK